MTPSLICITDPADPRLGPFLRMRDRNLRAEHGGRRFLCEGRLVIERAVACGIELESVLAVEAKAAAMRALVSASTSVLACPKKLMEAAAGFALHQGLVAVGRTPVGVTLDGVLAAARTRGGPGTLVVCPEVTNVDNLGLLVRVAAGLGADGMVLGPGCADPWYRRAVRTSMGTVFSLPLVRTGDLAAELERLRAADYELVATVIDADASALADFVRGGGAGTAVLLGSEGYGLDAATVAACARRVRIPMHRGVDSLNVAVAAGVVLYEVMRGVEG